MNWFTALPAILTGIGTLTSKGPKIPNYSPEEMLRNFQMFYRQLQGGPIGQQMFGNANRASSLYRNSLAGAQAASGMGSTGIGLARHAGAGAVGSIARNDVLAQLAQMAQSMSQQSLEGQTIAGLNQYKAGPHGLQALIGQMGTSSYPLMQWLEEQFGKGGGNKTPFEDVWMQGRGGTPPFNPSTGRANAYNPSLAQSPGAMQSMSPTSPPFGGTSPYFPNYRGR